VLRTARSRAPLAVLLLTMCTTALLSCAVAATRPAQLQAQRLDAADLTAQAPREPFHRLAPAVRAQPGPTSQAVAAPPVRATQHVAPTAWGLIENGWPYDTSGFDSVVDAVHRTPQYMEWYFHWGGGWSTYGDALPFLQAAAAHGATPIVTWMSDNPNTPTATPFTLQAIASGRYDGFIQSWALGVRSFGSTVILRFDPEMNGYWMAWSQGRAGQTAADYVNAWRHVHGVFAAAGATNVQWMWSPNVEYNGEAPLPAFYPGDAYVDWAALDGYNWGDTYGHAWQSFSQVFDASIAAVQHTTAKPLMLAEVGCAPDGGDKAAWIADMFTQLAGRPYIKAFLWFDLDKENDWRIRSSAASADAFAAGVASLPAA
jgi:hypothetical protein